MFKLEVLKNDRKLVKRSLDKIYKIIESGEKNDLLTDLYFQLNTLNENIKDCKRIEIETLIKEIHSINYDLRQLGQYYWNDKKNKTIQKCIDDIDVIYNTVRKHKVFDLESNF